MRRGMILGAGSALAMGAGAPGLKILADSALSPVNVIQGRMGIGAVCLLLVALATRRKLSIPRSQWWLVAVYGVVTLAVNHVVFVAALTWMPVGITLLIEYLAPVFIALWVRFGRGQRLPGALWVGIAATLVGLALISQVWAGAGLSGIGLLLALISAVTYAARFLLTEHGLRSHDPIVMATWGAGLGTVVLLPLERFPFDRIGADEVGMLLWVGVVSMALGMLLNVGAQRTISSAAASLMASLEIVIGGALAAILLGERL
ncbi:MAG TPA: DMT family transporter, partial [Actinokineospora sp.]|nr:DMT family transporter [Actinokineospora sp.]